MSLFKIPVVYSMKGSYVIEAANLQEAERFAFEAPLPPNGEYLDGSFELDVESDSFGEIVEPPPIEPGEWQLLKLGYQDRIDCQGGAFHERCGKHAVWCRAMVQNPSSAAAYAYVCDDGKRVSDAREGRE